MTVLIIGASGFLGTELVHQASVAGRATAATFNSRPGDAASATWHQLDLRDALRLDAVLDTVAPSAVINASSGDADWAVTADGPLRLAMATASRGIRLVHVSSDAIFSGTDVHYDETARHVADQITAYTDDPANSVHQLVTGSRRALADLHAVRSRWQRATRPPTGPAAKAETTVASRAGPRSLLATPTAPARALPARPTPGRAP